MQLSLFDEETLDRMVEEGKDYMIKRQLESKIDLGEYAHKLIMYDMANGRLDIPELTMESFDFYIEHAKKVCNNDAMRLVEYLQSDLTDKYEFLYNRNKIRQMYPFVR